MPEAGQKMGWFKGLLATLGGLFSGAAVMCLTPWVDTAVKPARPVANFRYERDGLTVRFENVSTSASSGWWDFGDGSPLVPLSSDLATIQHSYPQAGEYSARLLVRNLMGEENERSVLVRLDDTPTQTQPPQIVSVEAIPLSPGSYAPASYRILTSVKNAQVCVWDLGDDRPLEVTTETVNMNPIVTFPRAGGYIIKLAALNGKQYDEWTEIIEVVEPPVGALRAVVSVMDRGNRRETRNQTGTFGVPFPPESKESAYRFERQTQAPAGYRIREVRIAPGSKGETILGDRSETDLDPGRLGMKSANGLKVTLAQDRQSVLLRGELQRSTNKKDPLPSLVLPYVMVLEREKPVEHPAVQLSAALTAPPGAAPRTELLKLPPVPSDMTQGERRLQIELCEGNKVVWKGSDLPANPVVPLGRKRVQVQITRAGDQLKLELRDVTGRTVSSN